VWQVFRKFLKPSRVLKWSLSRCIPHPPVALRGHLVDAEKRFRLIPRSRAGKPHLAFEKQLFTEWIFPLIVGAVIVALRPLPAKGLFE
jgi:hypothetical protein